jgi:hypothetical protein
LQRKGPAPPAPPYLSCHKLPRYEGRYCRRQIQRVTVEERSPARDDGAAAQTKADLFSAEAYDAGVTKAPDGVAIDGRAQGLGSIVDNADVPAASEVNNPLDIGRITEQVGTITALVLLVMTASTVSTVRFSSAPTSASTGNAPSARTGGTTALQQKAGTITSSLCPTSHLRKASSSAKLPEPVRHAASIPSVWISRERSSLRAVPSTTLPMVNDRRMARYVGLFQKGIARATR